MTKDDITNEIIELVKQVPEEAWNFDFWTDTSPTGGPTAYSSHP